MDGKIMQYGDTMGRDGESLALKLWRGSAVGGAPTVPSIGCWSTRKRNVSKSLQALLLSHLSGFAMMFNHGLIFQR